MKNEFIPTKDGIDHINIYTKGKTELGRFLSNFAKVDIVTDDGDFSSIEGYWYWLSAKDERFRKLDGFAAKKLGKSLPRTKMDEGEFRRKIAKACWYKIHVSAKYHTLLKDSTLPFAHYYVYGDTAKDAGFEWLVKMWEGFRSYIRKNYYHGTY